MFHEMSLKLYFMKCSERNVSQCILALNLSNNIWELSESRLLPDSMGEGHNVVPLHKKGNKQILNNYRLVSLLLICSKLFEKIIFDKIFQHLTVNKLLNSNQ